MLNEIRNYQIEPVFEDNEISVVFCPDDKYVKYFGVLLQSFIDNANPNRKYDLLIFENDIQDKNKSLLQKMLPENFSLRFYDVTKYIENHFSNLSFNSRKYWSITTFYRLFVPFVMQKYKKVLYLDSDICINHNIDGIFDINTNGKELLAVKDTISPRLFLYTERKEYMQKILNLQVPENYFNAGVVLFDIKNINLSTYKEKLLKSFEIDDLWYLDQDILNMLFENKTEFIHNRWNFMVGFIERNKDFSEQISGDFKKNFMEARENPYIIHYSSRIKPWNAPRQEYAEIFWNFARKTNFYEEIIYANCKNSLMNNTINHKIAINRKRYYIYCKYYFYKIISIFSFGKFRTHLQNKKSKYKDKVREIREIKMSI